ncbi:MULTISPECIES: DMT family transporter [unclassified Azospirillum]|uniref:DMT family transporter n=1 Tax=unclassified Azospirillum TaxID=2630922 RepID=UPI000B757AE3|nr:MULTISPECIES: DMT family transporter [unclassified Azospirillum]SNS30082.1 EamA-like transporter family protein [Azospirillum sp. RU38E]SNS48517.1 EamA-like transporter family protein [Azospirillum sp. RU37A]
MGGKSLIGIAWFQVAILCFAVMDAAIKYLTADFGTWQIMFFRGFFSLIPIAMLTARSGGLGTLRTSHLLSHVGRALIGIAAAFCFFYAYSIMPLADAYAIAFAGPLFMTALSVPVLKEKVGWRRWLAVLVGFAGVIVMLRPGQGMLTLTALVPLAAAAFYALTMLYVRVLARTESNAAITFYFVTTMSIMATIAMIPEWRTPQGWQWLLLIMVGVIGGVAQIAFTQAFRLTSPSLLAPFEYTAMIWAVLFGYLLFGDIPDKAIWIGGAIVVAAGLYIIHRETVLHRQVASHSRAAGETGR